MLQVISGAGNLGEDLEQKMKDSPMLQPKMKPRASSACAHVADTTGHLQMIAVGGSIGTGAWRVESAR